MTKGLGWEWGAGDNLCSVLAGAMLRSALPGEQLPDSTKAGVKGSESWNSPRLGAKGTCQCSDGPG